MAMPAASRRPYIIFRRPPGRGFWSDFLWVIQGLDYADRHDLVPVVDMERYCTRYSDDDDRLLGTRNAWEYYFAQPGGLTVAEALQLDPLDNEGGAEGCFAEVHAIEPPTGILDRARELLNRYIRVRPEILEEIESISGANFRAETLGVHVGTSDIRSGRILGEPVPAPSLVYLEQAAALDRKLHFSRIFLACNESDTVTLFKEYFGDRLLTTEVFRVPSATSDFGGGQWRREPRRELHRYHLGREVLMDALLLCRCGQLLCGVSIVTHAAMYFSDGRQSVHPVPPLWCHPLPNEVSRGRSFVSDCPSLMVPLSVDALKAQSENLQRLLEDAENLTLETAKEVARESEALRGQVANLSHQVSAGIGELKLVRKELLAVQKELDKANSHISRLKRRVTQLVNGWTWLGWRLMRWTKPSWRENPLDE